MTEATIYIQNFDQSSQVSTLGKITYDADGSASNTNGTLNAFVSTSTLQTAFKFKSDGADFTEETAQVKYTNSTLTPETYSWENSPDPSLVPLDFVQQLAKEVFGSTSAVDLFSNEDDVAQGVKNAIVSCNQGVNTIATGNARMTNDQPGDAADSANPTSGDGISGGQPGSDSSLLDSENNTTTSTGAQGALDVLNALLEGFESRFELAYTVSTTTDKTIAASGDLTEQTAASNSGTGEDLKLNFNFNTAGDTVEQVTVHTAGSGYASGDVLTFNDTSDGTNNSITITLRDTDLNAINGASNFVAMPIQADDVIQMVYTITSADGQKDASGDDCSISRRYLIQLTAN